MLFTKSEASKVVNILGAGAGGKIVNALEEMFAMEMTAAPDEVVGDEGVLAQPRESFNVLAPLLSDPIPVSSN